MIMSISCYVGGFRQVDGSLVCRARAVGEFVARVDEHAREQSVRVLRKKNSRDPLSLFPFNHTYLRPQGQPLGLARTRHRSVLELSQTDHLID